MAAALGGRIAVVAGVSGSDVGTVRRIRRLLAAGLTTATIAQVLPCLRDDGPILTPVCSDLVHQLKQERARITLAIEDLQTSRGMLDSVIAASPADVSPGATDSAPPSSTHGHEPVQVALV